MQGSWSEAVDEALRAGEAGARFRIAAQATIQLAEIHRMRGEFETAADEYRRVTLDGGNPMPGSALLKLAQGQPDAALTSITEALGETSDFFERLRILPALAEIAIAAQQIPEAIAAADELCNAASSTGNEVHHAWAEHALGRVALAEGRLTQAVVHLKEAQQLWRVLSLPYELARARVDLARALRARGDGEGADLELGEARAVFAELGAAPDVRLVDDLMSRARSTWPGGLTDREVEVLRLLASGATNRAIAADLVLSERTVDRHVSNIFTKIDVPTRAAATAWAFRNGVA